MKGEIKELLVDIRDLVNKNENPFCSIPCSEALKHQLPEKNEAADNQPALTDSKKQEMNPVAEVPKPWDQIVKNNGNFPELTRSGQGNFVQNTQKQEIYRPEPESIRKIDTFTLVELMRWVDYAVRTIGHNNLEGLLDLYALTGHLPEETKMIIENIASLSMEEHEKEDRASMQDNITVLSQLSAILSPEGFRKSIQPLYETSQG